MRNAALIVAVLVTLASVGVSAAGSSAHSFVADIYARYRESGVAPNSLGKSADAIFAQPLLALIRAEQKAADGEAGALDFDPICACQDFKLSRVRIDPITEGRTTARYNVHFLNFGKKQHLTLFLAKENGSWKISDIKSDLAPSLQDYLRKQQR